MNEIKNSKTSHSLSDETLSDLELIKDVYRDVLRTADRRADKISAARGLAEVLRFEQSGQIVDPESQEPTLSDELENLESLGTEEIARRYREMLR